MDDLVTPVDWRESPASEIEIQRAVTKLGLDFSLVTKWTAFVAVSEKVVNEHPEELTKHDVPLNRVEGVSELAYARPRPEKTVAGLLITAAAGATAIRRRRRKDRS